MEDMLQENKMLDSTAEHFSLKKPILLSKSWAFSERSRGFERLSHSLAAAQGSVAVAKKADCRCSRTCSRDRPRACVAPSIWRHSSPRMRCY